MYGSTSAAARLSADKWKTEDAKAREQEVLAELHGDASALLLRLNASPPDDAAPVLGPVLHRWGSAFCSTPEGSNPPVQPQPRPSGQRQWRGGARAARLTRACRPGGRRGAGPRCVRRLDRVTSSLLSLQRVPTPPAQESRIARSASHVAHRVTLLQGGGIRRERPCARAHNHL